MKIRLTGYGLRVITPVVVMVLLLALKFAGLIASPWWWLLLPGVPVLGLAGTALMLWWYERRGE